MKAPVKGRATLAEVAEASGVAVSTVSLVLNDKAGQVGISARTEKSVRQAAQRLGYSPNRNARSLRLQRSGLAGVVLGDIASEAASCMFAGIRTALERSGTGMEPLLTCHDYQAERERKELEFLVQNHVETIIATPFGPFARNYQPLVDEGIPVVFLAHGLAGTPPDVSRVLLDSKAMSREAVRYLSACGARRIAYVAWDYGTDMSRGKLDGIRVARAERAGPAVISDILALPHPAAFDAGLDRLFTSPSPPDALLCNPFDAAFACLDYLDRRGIAVPAQCAVMSLSDHPVFQMRRLSVTAMRQDFTFLGCRAADIALAELAAKKRPPTWEVHSVFEIAPRATTPSLSPN